MTTINPFVHDDRKGEVWELGYLAGFAEPDEDHFRPYAPDLLEVYKLGERGGQNDRRNGPTEEASWAEEITEHGLIHVLGVGIEKAFQLGEHVGGLISLVLTVVTIPGDVELRPLEPEWEGPADEGDVSYVVACGQKDHPMGVQGTTSDGYWLGTVRSNFEEAFSDFRDHGHPEAVIVRCSPQEGTCGPVWPIE